MKNFKRKLARVFGLALRSDLLKINESYERMCRVNNNSQREIFRYKKLWRDTQAGFDKYIKDND